MTLRKWTLGMAVAAAALIPISANADSVMNLPASSNYNPSGSIAIDFTGVTAETGNIDSGLNGGSCSIAGGGGRCLETTYGAGKLNDVYNNISSNSLWTGGVASAANSGGLALGFVIYGIADASVTVSNGIESVDNTGATASGGLIHIDLYSMSAANSPCFTSGCGANLVTAANVAGVTNTSNSNVFHTATLFAAFTLQSGVVPLNTAADGTSNARITLTQNFNTANSKGTGNFYAICNSGPGCADFTKITESNLDATGTGYAGDPAFAKLLTQIFGELDVTGPTTGESGAGWGLTIKDPVFAVDTHTQVPEPASLGLLGTGLALFGVAIGRRRRKGISA